MEKLNSEGLEKFYSAADEKETVGFATGEEYEKARAELLKELE